MAVDPIIKLISTYLVPEYCHGLQSSTGYTAPPFSSRILACPLKSVSTFPAIVYAFRGISSYMFNIKHLYRAMPSQSPHQELTPVIRNGQSLAVFENQQKSTTSGNSQHPHAQRCVFVPAGKREFCSLYNQRGQNSTPSSLLKNSCIADIPQPMAFTAPTTEWQSISTATAMLGTSSHSPSASGGTSQKDSMCCVLSSPASGIASTPTPLSGPEYRPTPIPNQEAHTIISNPLRMRVSAMN